MTEVEFVKFLNEHLPGLRQSVGELIEEQGSQLFYEFGNIVKLPTRPFFKEHREAFYINLDLPCTSLAMSPRNFSCDFNALGDARKNHALALKQLSQIFSKPKAIKISNALKHVWHFGKSSFEITSFLKDQDNFSQSNAHYAKYPELWDFCTMSVDLQLFAELSDEERSQLERAYDEGAILRFGLNLSSLRKHVFDSEQAYVRLNSPEFFGRWRHEELPSDLIFWTDAHNGQLGWVQANHSFFMKREQVKALCLRRVEAAKGGAYSELSLDYENPSLCVPTKNYFQLVQNERTEGLDSLAHRLAEFWALPLESNTEFNC